MTKKDAKIRGHEMALANARRRGDKAGVAKQTAAIRSLGGSVSRGGAHKPASSKRGGKRYKHNPDGESAVEAAKEKAQEAHVEAKEAKVAEKQAEKAADASGTRAARVAAAVASRRARSKAAAEEKAKGKVESAKEKRAARRARVGAGVGKTSPQGRRTRRLARQQAARDKKIAASKKAAMAGEKPAKRARKATKGKTMAKRTKASYQAAAEKGAETRRKNAKAAAKPRKAAKRKTRTAAQKKAHGARRRRSRFPSVPRSYKRKNSRISIRAKNRKTGKRKVFVRTRAYKSNPMSDLGQLAVLGGGVVVGMVLSDLLRRYVATMAPKGAKEPTYSYMSGERFAAHPDGMQYAAQGALGLLGLGAAYLTMKKSPGISRFLAGVGVGALAQAVLEVVNFAVMPSLFSSKEGEKTLGNRLYPMEQKYQQDFLTNQIKQENTALGTGALVSNIGQGTVGPAPAAGTTAGHRGLAGLPAPQQTRQLPPAQGQGARPSSQGQGQLAGTPGQVGCGGAGGCGQKAASGCTGGRNCGCPSCSGADVGFGTIAPAADRGATNGVTTAGAAPRAGNINGPRQLGAHQNVSFMPRPAQARKAMAFGR